MEFPRNVYISPGDIEGNLGVTYGTILVENEEELKAALKEGFMDSFEEATKVVKKTPLTVKKELSKKVEKEEPAFEEDDF